MHRSKGFSIIELVMVIVLVSIIGTVVGQALLNDLLIYQKTKGIDDLFWQSNIAVSKFTADLMTLRSQADLTTASASQCAFTNDAGESISYTQSGSTFTRNGAPVAGNIASVAFTYRDANGTATSVLANIRYVIITLDLTSSVGSYSQSSMIATRVLP